MKMGHRFISATDYHLDCCRLGILSVLPLLPISFNRDESIVQLSSLMSIPEYLRSDVCSSDLVPLHLCISSLSLFAFLYLLSLLDKQYARPIMMFVSYS